MGVPFKISSDQLFNEGCPEGWTLIGDECYRISQDNMNWFQAQEYCWGNNGFLAEIKTEKQQSSLGDILFHTIPYYWIGLSDNANEGTFVWAESHESLDYNNWAPGEPNNDKGGEDCVHMDSAEQLQWNDISCDSVRETGFHALCQLNSKL